MYGSENTGFGLFNAPCFAERRAKLEEAKAVVKANLNKELNRSTGLIEYTFKKGVMRWSWNGFKAKFVCSIEDATIKGLVEHLNFDNFKEFTEFAKGAKSEDMFGIDSGVMDEIDTLIAKGRKKPKGKKEKIELLNIAFPIYLEKVKTPAPKTVYRATRVKDVTEVTDVEAKEIKTARVVEKVAGVDYPMGVNLNGIWTFTWNGITVNLGHVVTEETIISVKEMGFEEFKAFAAKVNEPSSGQGPSTVEKPDVAEEDATTVGVPSMRVSNDGTYIFTWEEYTIEKPMDEVSVEFIAKVMTSSFNEFELNAKAAAASKVSTESTSEPNLKDELKEATASLNQKPSVKDLVDEDKLFGRNDGKAFYKSVRRKR